MESKPSTWSYIVTALTNGFWPLISLGWGFIVAIERRRRRKNLNLKGANMSDKMKVEVEVSKETYELGKGVAAFVEAVKASQKDGWQTGADVPAVITAAIADLVPAMDGMSKVKDEVADKVAFANACALVGAAVLAAAMS